MFVQETLEKNVNDCFVVSLNNFEQTCSVIFFFMKRKIIDRTDFLDKRQICHYSQHIYIHTFNLSGDIFRGIVHLKNNTKYEKDYFEIKFTLLLKGIC